MTKEQRIIAKQKDEKRCNICGLVKPISLFYKEPRSPDGYRYTCKECQNIHSLLSYKKLHSSYEWRAKRCEKAKIHYSLNRDNILLQNKESYRNNSKNRIKQKKSYLLQKKQENPVFSILLNLRTRTGRCFRKISNGEKPRTKDLLGIELDSLKIYIESQFIKGMEWTNYGEWEIDHKIPLSLAKTREELIQYSHYTNLQPLWKSDNRSKKDNLIEHQILLPI